MAAKRIGIMDIRQIIQLKIKKCSNRKIADLTGIHRNSVNTYVQLIDATNTPYSHLSNYSDEQLLELFPSTKTNDKERYMELSAQFEYYRKELKKTGCTKLTLWKEYKKMYIDGYSRSQFNEHLNRWLKRVDGSGKLIHLAGDKLYVDYTGKMLSYVDKKSGEVIEVAVFVATLPCSGYTFVEATLSQKIPDFIGSMNRCLRFLGGVPKAIVPDNLKSAVTKASKYQATINKTFQDFALHYDCVISPARAIKPQDKALVENAVRIVYNRIFYPLNKMTFFSLYDLNKELAKYLIQYNDYLLSHIKVSRRQQFLDIEKSTLEDLPSENYELRFFKKATVQKMGFIFLNENKNYYSVPHRFIGKSVEVSYNSQSVDIHYDRQRIATHKRNLRPGKYNIIQDHLSSAHKFYSEWSPAFFEKQAAPLGDSVKQYVKVLIESKKYPEEAYKQCLGIVNLTRSYDKKRINTACKYALELSRYGYHIIEKILKNKTDLIESILPKQDENTTQNHISPHSNIRGADAFS